MKYVLVMGSTKGMGKAIADAFEKKGYIVIRNGRSESSIENYIQADLSTEDGVDELLMRLKKITSKLDYVVYGVGTTCRKPFRETTYKDLQSVMDTNVNMPFLLAEKIYTYMNENGSILFVSSAMSKLPHATSIPYGISKAALNMLAQSLVKEYAELGVRVNAICPGFIETEWQMEKPEWLRTKIAGKTALNRFGSPDEVAQMSIAICENTYMNGAIISVDGGYNMIH